MKNKMFMIASLLVCVVAFAAGVKEDVFKIGKPGSTADKVIELGSTRRIRSNETSGKLEFTNDNSIWKNLGSGSGGGAGGVNLLAESNPAFEDGIGIWSATGGVYTIEETTPLFGLISGKWDAAAAADTFVSPAIALTAGQLGRTCAIAFDYKWDGGTLGHLKVEAVRNAGQVGEETILVTDLVPSSGPAPFIQFFSCPETQGDTLQFRLRATDDAALLEIDSAFIGSGLAGFVGSEIVQQSMRGSSGSKVGSGDILNFIIGREFGSDELFEWSGNFITVLKPHFANITYEHNSTNGTSAAQIFLNAPTQIVVGQSNCSNTSFDCGTAFNGFVQAGDLIRFASSAGADNGRFSYHATAVKKSASETLTVETSGSRWVAAIKKTTPGPLGIGLAASTVAGIGDANLELVQLEGETKIACVTGTSNGADCSGSSELLGFSFTPNRSGLHEVCTSMITKVVGSAADGIFQIFYLERIAAPLSAGALIERGINTGISGGYDSASGSSDYYHGVNYCNEFELDAGEESHFKVSVTKFIVNSEPVVNNLLDLPVNHAAGGANVVFKVRDLTQSVPSPVFTEVKDSIALRTVGTRQDMKTAVCKFTVVGGGPPSFDSYCNDWVDNVVRNSLGNYTINFIAGTFSADPVCLANIVASNNSIYDTSAQGATPTSIQVLTKLGGNPVDAGFTFICGGQK